MRAVEICAQMIDESGVTYQVTGRNSNSIASTIAACFGLVEPSGYIGLSTPGANKLLLSPAQIIQAQIMAGFDAGPGISNNRCFMSGTHILMKGGNHKPIEQICPGDEVLAFNNKSSVLPFEGCRVSRIFVNQANMIIDLRGLRCTPGHVFLTGDIDARGHGKFATIASILRNDKTIVERDATVIRARTGARLGTSNDALVAVVYRDHPTVDMPSVERRIVVRAGIPMPAATLADGAASVPTEMLAGHLAAHGIAVLPDGSLRTADGAHHAACNWPEGSTPFDTHEARNWIVEADGEPYTPSWIRDLVEEDERPGLRVVGALPVISSAAAPANLL